MKKFIFLAAFLTMTAGAYAQSKQVVNRTGNDFQVTTVKKNATVKRDTLVTAYTFTDSKGNKRPIVINKNSGACYVCRISKNGNFYRQYMKKEISAQIANELGIEYKPNKKQES